MDISPSSSYSITIRVEIVDKAGMFARLASTIGAHGGSLDAVDLVRVVKGAKRRDVTIDCRNEEHAREILNAVRKVEGVRLISWSDRVFLMHLGGKIRIENKIPVNNRNALSMAYTPGVARVCMDIAEDRDKAFNLTIKQNTVAVVSDGTAVLGLGDIGPEAAMPVMEGKAMLFKEFGGVDAFPICLATKDPQEIIDTVKRISPGFGGINLEDISAPRCFEIEERLKKDLDIPVFHDDQHGTAVVTLAALKNALKIVDKKLQGLKVVISGVGAAGVACARIMLNAGIEQVIGVDRSGAIYRGRKEHMNYMKDWFAEHTNPERVKGDLGEAIRGADLFLGVSAPGVLKAEHLQTMARDPIVFAMANPVPEIMPEEAEPYVRIMATGRSDYPNQINNVLCFPGLFRGCLDVRARDITEEMKLAAAEAIASIITDDELSEEYIIPSVFDRRVAKAVATAVGKAAFDVGSARRSRGHHRDICHPF